MTADTLRNTLSVAVSGMKAQTERMKIISQNIANANAVSEGSDTEPYRRQTITFQSELDRSTKAHLVEVKNVGLDQSSFKTKYEPNHPAANAEGYVKYSNVNTIIEMWDMKEANRSFQANLSAYKTARKMHDGMVDLLRV